MDVDESSHGNQSSARTTRSSRSIPIRLYSTQPLLQRAPSDEVPESDPEQGDVEDEGEEGKGSDNEEYENQQHELNQSKNDNHQYPLAHQNLNLTTSSQPRRASYLSTSSLNSLYSPSISSISSSSSHAHQPQQTHKAFPAFASTPHRHPPHSIIPPTPSQPLPLPSSPLKRPRARGGSSASSSPGGASDYDSHGPEMVGVEEEKEEGSEQPPPKRLRHPPTSYNPSYLALLNDEILSAAERFTPQHDWDTPLQPSQIGLIYWTDTEKTLFFEALARLGPQNAKGIAERVRTKGELEVMEYIRLLQEERDKWKRDDVVVLPEEVPAAVELTQACCAALEEAADAVAARQETYEEGVEKKKWGSGVWLVTEGNLDLVERDERLREAAEVFRLRNWLRLSERIFMNSTVEDYNWVFVPTEDGEPRKPAIRATAVQDFHAIVVSLVRRVVAAALYVAESRIRIKKRIHPRTRAWVKPKDVEAAVLSLGLRTRADKWRRFWATCARRLRIDVVDQGEGDEEKVMDFAEVERALGVEPEVIPRYEDEDMSSSEDEGSEEEDLPYLKDEPSSPASNTSIDLAEAPSRPPSATPAKEETPSDPEDENEKATIDRELLELLHHSALELPSSRRARDALRKRLRAELRHEAHADKLDMIASQREERMLWALLGKEPPVPLGEDWEEGVEVDKVKGLGRRTVEEVVRAYKRGGGSRRGISEAPSRWEMEWKLEEQRREEVGEKH